MALQISNEYDEVALANLINKAEGEDESLTINEMSEIIHLYSNIQNLTFELTAPVYLTKEILCCITSDDFGLDIAEGLLEKLFRYGYLDRYYPKYYLKDLYKGMLINRKKPSPKIFEKLIEFELSKDDFSYEQAINTLEYIDGAMFTERKRKMKILGVLDKLANNLSESSSLPSQPVLNKYFEAVRDDAKPKIMMLYARYKECQGKYEEGLEILNSLSGKEEVDQLKLKFLDKSGNFQGMLEIIKKYIGKDPNITPVAESPWNPAIVQYYGRYLQCTGSLAKALKTYELIEEFEDADVAIRIHSLIEQATICVFAEEPDLALNLLKKAERYTPSDDSEIFRHKIDVYRYLSRAYKLRANFHDNQDRIQDLKDAHKYKEKSKEMAIEYFYNEGLIWASVLEGRLAYFDDNFEVAINKFSEADWLINESSYYGAIPHLHRHMALAYAANKEFGNAKEHIIIAWKHTVKSKRLYMRGLITDTWAKLKVMEGNVESAKKLLRSAMNAYDKCGLFQPPFSRLRDRIQNSLEDPKYLLRENKIW